MVKTIMLGRVGGTRKRRPNTRWIDSRKAIGCFGGHLFIRLS